MKDTLAAVVMVPVMFLWTFGGLIGAIIEASRDDLLGVVLAIFIPGYGAFVTAVAAIRYFF